MIKVYKIKNKHYPFVFWYRLFIDKDEGAYCWYSNNSEAGWSYTSEVTIPKLFSWHAKADRRYSIKEVSMLEIVVVAGYPDLI